MRVVLIGLAPLSDTDGPLKVREYLEVPPYAELVIQGFHGLAIRHPEYMLARDLECLLSMYRQCEALLNSENWDSPPKWAAYAVENIQTLGRAAIQSCFALLESFASGLARAHVMLNDGLAIATRGKLLDNGKPLKSRLIAIPELITGQRVPLDINKPPMSRLFGDIKERRDAFVHCEPGEEAGRGGYVKEEQFHDVLPDVIEESVKLTAEVIRIVWSHVHSTQSGPPRWLPDLSSSRTESGRNLRLVPVVNA